VKIGYSRCGVIIRRARALVSALLSVRFSTCTPSKTPACCIPITLDSLLYRTLLPVLRSSYFESLNLLKLDGEVALDSTIDTTTFRVFTLPTSISHPLVAWLRTDGCSLEPVPVSPTLPLALFNKFM